MDREKLTKSLEIDEGLRLFPYKCSANKWSIGFGRNFEDNPFTLNELIFLGLKERTFDDILARLKQKGITKSDAYYLLENDIDKVESQLKKALPWFVSAPDNVQLVLANMCFNLGLSRLLRFKNTLSLLKEGKYEEASVEMLNSKWKTDVGDRAIRLSELLKQTK